MDSSQPNAAERERSYRVIRGAMAAIEVVRPGAVETATFLLSEAESSFVHTVAESANLESKATTLLGIVAGATSVLGVFGTRDGKAIFATPAVAVAMIFVVIALVCLLYILRAKRFDSPDLGSFISAAMIREDNRPGLALVLAETYRTMRHRLRLDSRDDGRALFLAYAATAAASLALLLNAVTVPPGTTSFQAGGRAATGTPAPGTKP
jgi:hypothetical protein